MDSLFRNASYLTRSRETFISSPYFMPMMLYTCDKDRNWQPCTSLNSLQLQVRFRPRPKDGFFFRERGRPLIHRTALFSVSDENV